MLVIFKSKAAADIIMYEEHARRILDLLHKDIHRGIITAAETAGAIAALEAEIAATREEPAGQEDSGAHEREHNTVGLATRLFPFLEMLRAANRKGKDVMWGV